MDQDFTDYALATFQDDLDRFGARLNEWPDDVRELATAFLDVSSDARTLLEAARALWDSTGTSLPKAPVGLKERILKAALSSETPEGAAEDPNSASRRA